MLVNHVTVLWRDNSVLRSPSAAFQDYCVLDPCQAVVAALAEAAAVAAAGVVVVGGEAAEGVVVE